MVQQRRHPGGADCHAPAQRLGMGHLVVGHQIAQCKRGATVQILQLPAGRGLVQQDVQIHELLRKRVVIHAITTSDC